MPKRKRTSTAKKGWKTRNKISEVQHLGAVKRRKLWDPESMTRAMNAVISKEMGVNKAAEQFDVPRTTLKDRISGRVKHGAKPGPPGFLTPEEDQELVDFLVECCKMGNGKTKREVIDCVKRLMEKKRAKEGLQMIKFNGEGWWYKFMKRHSELSLRTSDPLSHCRFNAVSQSALDNYFVLLRNTLEVNGLMDKPSYIYNMDESGMPLDHKQLKRVALKGIKKVHGPSSGNKAQITILACANAVGTMIPPMVIFKGERLNYEWTRGEVPDTKYAMSPQGWTDHELFFEWLSKQFTKSIPPSRPVLLLLDGHSSHFTLEAIKFAAENEIILFCLPPHTTHVPQPLDVSFFGPLKKHWSRVCHEYMADNPGKVVTRSQFSSLFNKAWFLSIQPHTIVSGFRKVGVYPFNSTAIKPYDNSSISNKIPEATPVMMTQPNERSSVSQDGFSEHNLEESGPGLSPVSYSEEQIELFQRRYDNGYNIYDDQMYVSWLQQQHPDDLPENLSSSTTIETQVNGEQVEPLNCNTSTEDDSTVDKENVVPSPEQPMDSTVDKENVVPSPEQPTYSLSASLANTRVFVSELREILGERRVVSKASTKSKSTARVLTSAESLALLIEKEKKKQEEEEQKAKRKEERDRKRQEKEEEKKS